ncbi:hypothetical protein SSBR45G_38030 [Bradyrhizobium sp. SSBR45G]|uniref:hypothetical protein n=1 Tax=unclassified Bradyrhizobium TaxID=2631580 RepID=UPI002342B692|nr:MULTISPECIES: hypothetical protein [unclassified Bradyrhizobium]GLH78894.1 hypothetical protein SSBR45G_38030 [Bradyrhizobium sp. SSBR45G]GLH86392.1 hypothetical protein SSBR45R_38520 [Bradyrhizobium sp. SSBR45R]
MIGITLSADQIRSAPPEVRRWIEHQVLASLGLGPEAAQTPALPTQGAHLVACSIEDAAKVLAQIQSALPAVNVFFEFGRPGIAMGQPPIMMFRLIDILHHTRLQNIGQVMASLEMINKALVEVRHDPSVRFCGFDNEGHCLIAPETQRAIASVWQSVIARQHGVAEGEAA